MLCCMVDFKVTKAYMKIPKGFKKFYSEDEVLLLGGALFGKKQGAMGFWKKMLKAKK